MDRIFESGAAVAPPAAPASPSTGYATAGNPGAGVPATKPGAWWFHQVTEELRAVIVAAGLTPDHTVLTQLRDALTADKRSTSLAKTDQQTLFSGAFSVIAYNTVEWDDLGLWNAAGSRFIAPRAGKYRFSGNGIFMESTNDGPFWHEVWKNGVPYKRGAEIDKTTVNISAPFDIVVPMAAADYVQINARFENASASINAYGYPSDGQLYSYCQVTYVGP
jgi:hypothetical protein